MKHLIIAPEAYPVPSRGTSVETCIYNIAVRLARHHSVTVVSRRDKSLPGVTITAGLRILRVPAGVGGRYIRNVVQVLAGERFDYVQIDNRPSYLPSIRRLFPRTPISLFLHSLNFVTPPRACIATVNLQMKYADLVVANSNSLKARLGKLYPVHEPKLQVAHLGVSTTKFRPPTAAERTTARQQHGLRDEFAIVYVGRLVSGKGIAVLFRAVELVRRHVPRVKLLIVGGGRNRYVAALKTAASRARVPIVFTGPIAPHRIQRLYWAADCVVCPSQDHEAFGLVVVEAMASGLPTVASRNGGLQEVITHNFNGLLVDEFDDPAKFAQAIQRVANNPAFARELGQQGRVTCIERFSWQATADTLRELYFRGE